MTKYKPKPTVFIGIDPGVMGGISVLRINHTIEDKIRPLIAYNMPDTYRGIHRLFTSICQPDELKNKLVTVCMEKVTGYIASSEGKPDTGAKPGARMFTFGSNRGALCMASIAAFNIFPREYTPMQWQRGLHIQKRGYKKPESREDYKRRLKKIAQVMYPSVKVTSSTADAILIATYHMRKIIG